MKKIFAFLILFIGLSLSSCTSENTPDKPDDPISRSYSELEKEFIKQINEHRTKNVKVKSMTVSDSISLLCAEHVDYMIRTGGLSHDNRDVRRAAVKAVYKKSKSTSENVGVVYDTGDIKTTAKLMLDNYLSSTLGHKEAVEGPLFNHFGVSVKKASNGEIYNCVNFLEVSK